MPTADVHRWLITTLAALILQACGMNAKLGDAPYEISEDYANNVIRYTVQRGDRLSDIALEFTGNLNSWLPIAEHNGITDPKSLRVGSQLEIPTALIPGYEKGRLTRRAQLRQSTPEPGDSASTAQATLGDTASKPVSEAPDSASEPDPSEESNDSGSTVQGSTPERTPVSAEQEAQLSPEVRVVGTYYPKGVYARPTLDSRLMMRVSPGSDFVLVEQLNGWYRIDTDRGQGFLRTRDGRIIEADRKAGIP